MEHDPADGDPMSTSERMYQISTEGEASEDADQLGDLTTSECHTNPKGGMIRKNCMLMR